MVFRFRFHTAIVLHQRTASYLARRQNYYEILGVKSNATQDEIRKAFVKKSNELHPDRKPKQQDKRIGWRRNSDTELFMEVKEAYDCLRKPARRAAYDDQLTTAGGYLREATHLKFKKDTIVDLNRDRNEAYTGPRGRSAPTTNHFRDPEQEYYREKHKNRMLVVLAAIMASLVLANIGYVWYLRKARLEQLSGGLAKEK